MLKRGEVDIAYLLESPQAIELKRDPALRLAFSGASRSLPGLPRHVDPKSPWADHACAWPPASPSIAARSPRPRPSARPSLPAISCRARSSSRCRSSRTRTTGAGQEAPGGGGLPNGFDAGEFHQLPPYFGLGEAIVGYLGAVGIRTTMRPMERAAYLSALQAKKLKGVCVCSSALYANGALCGSPRWLDPSTSEARLRPKVAVGGEHSEPRRPALP